MLKKILKIECLLLSITFIFINVMFSFAITYKTFEDKIKVLEILNIIDDADDLDDNVTRAEFAKMIVKASPYKDTNSDTVAVTLSNDVNIDNPYISYINVALTNGYMVSYLGGLFKPNENVVMRDVARATLAVLSYDDSDFVGNLSLNRYNKFIKMDMSANITKNENDNVKGINDTLKKRDCINIIYDMLKETPKSGKNKLALSIFDKVIIDDNGEINADAMIDMKMKGPYVLDKDITELNLDFDIDTIYLNGNVVTMDELKSALYDYGILIYYYDSDRKTVTAYAESANPDTTVAVKKGYVQNINYDINSQLTPVTIEVDEYKYYLANPSTKLAFSYAGNIKVGDYIIFTYNKLYENGYYDDEKKERGVPSESYKDIGMTPKGSIIYVYKIK